MISTTKGPKKCPKWPKSAKNDLPFGVPWTPRPAQKGAFLPRPRPGRPGPQKQPPEPKKVVKIGYLGLLMVFNTTRSPKITIFSDFWGPGGRAGPAGPGPAGEPHFGPSGPGRAGRDPQNGQNHEKTPKNTFFPEMAGLLVQGSFLPRIYAGLTRFSEAHVRSSAILFCCF